MPWPLVKSFRTLSVKSDQSCDPPHSFRASASATLENFRPPPKEFCNTIGAIADMPDALTHTRKARMTHIGQSRPIFAAMQKAFPARQCDKILSSARRTKPMRRREFITLLGGAAAAWPLDARAQQPGKRPTIGFLGTATPSGMSRWTAALAQRLGELGWIEGRTVAIEYRWAEGRPERYAEIVAEFVSRRVDVIVTTVPAAPAAKQATSVIPIVFILASDPVGSGLVASLARPGGNVTGLSTQATDLASKRVELLREVVPDLKVIALLGNVDNPEIVLEMREVADAAHKLGLDVARLEIRRAEELLPALGSLDGRAQALYVCTDPLVNLSHVSINAWALNARLPTMHDVRAFVEAGGLLSYGPSFSDQFRRAADLVNKILRGARPGDIPVEQADKFELVVNLKIAKALGLTIPDKLIALADEVIE